MDPDIRELKHAIQEIAFGLSEALEADHAQDVGDKARYEELNDRARARVKKLLLRMGLSASGIHHRSVPSEEAAHLPAGG
jgi:hypothetical protein